MKRRTGLSSTRDWIFSWVGESGESDILSGVREVMGEEDVRCCCVVTAVAAGAKAVVHDADDRRAVAKMIGRIMVVKSM